MAVLLRRFNFFDKEVVKDPETNQVFEKLKDINISSCASGRGQIVIADCEGTVYMINRKFQITSFKAYDIRVSHLYQLKQFNILLTVGEDEEGVNPLIKVWNLDKFEKGTPVCSRICRAIPSNKPTPVTCLTVHENLNWMAVGFENGSVVIFKGDVKSDRHSKTWTVYENQKPITGLAFRPTGKNIILFVATDNCILSINLSARDKTTTLEQFGCNLGCSVMSDSNQDHQFVIGRQDGVYFYQPDCRGPCVVIEGEKLRLEWFRGYLIIVGKECKPLLKAPVSSHSLEMHTVTVYDMQNKFVAHTAPYPDVIDVLSEWGSLYVLSGDRKLYQLQEKDTQTKLEMLFKKNNYTLAISLARSQQYDQEGLIDIFTQYGDHLYGKGDHDGAIDQYIKTIGKLEASYVIRKFLDSQRIHNLTKYLQALHKAQMATEEHTTLLLNCYTKLKDVSKLDEFIMTKDREVDFDVETAIKVCRQAGYYEHALFLAEKHEKHEWYLRIQLEKIKDYQKALEYIGNLEFAEADDNLKKYGKMLMSEIPDQTTELLKKLCTDYRPSNRLLVDQSDLDGSVPRIQKASAEEFIHIFVNNSAKLTEFLEYMIKTKPNSPSLLYNTLLELYLHDIVHEGEDIEAKNEKQRRTLDLLQNPDANYDLDQALVLCQMNNFKAGILFLYEKAQLYQQILRYHMEHSENVHVIETCKKFGQHDPQLWVQALSYFAKKEESCKPQLMEVLSNIDKRNLLPPLLVIETLAHNSTATLSIIKDYIIRRLQLENDQIAEDERLIKQYREDTEKKRKQIEELKTTTLDAKIMMFLNETTKTIVGFLPGFDMSKLAKLESLFSPPCLTEAAIFHELQFMIMLTPACIAKAKIFQNSKCSICSHPLELPSVHFLCEPHSFHQQCLESYAENDTECPVCLPENRKIMDIIRAQEQSKDLHESFHNQLERSQDGFSVVADYFGRGVFNKVTVITDSNARFSASPPGRNLSSQFS